MILSLFRKKCTHKNVPKSVEEAYCPDCGELVKNSWYMARCSVCNVKRKAHITGNIIVSDTKFCPNCGGQHIEIEKIERLNFIDISYAIHVQEIIKEVPIAQNIVWADKNISPNPKLIPIL